MLGNIEFPELPDLHSDIFGLISQIPEGYVTTYGDLSRALGDERTASARWIGELLKNHEHGDECQCHRVVRSNGEVGHFVTGDSEEKLSLLESESVLCSMTGKVSLENRFLEFTTDRPLLKLKEFQRSLVQNLSLQPLASYPQSVAGVDCAYPSKGTAVAAYVELNMVSLQPVFELVIETHVRFPYIPGFLTFRELPALLHLFERVRQARELAEVIFVDGNGILHPWKAGIATCLGRLIDHPTLGVGKSLLCGTIQDRQGKTDREILYENEVLGYEMKSKKDSKPVYVSPGYGLSHKDAVRLAEHCFSQHRVPEPIYFADRLTKQNQNRLEK